MADLAEALIHLGVDYLAETYSEASERCLELCCAPELPAPPLAAAHTGCRTDGLGRDACRRDLCLTPTATVAASMLSSNGARIKLC